MYGHGYYRSFFIFFGFSKEELIGQSLSNFFVANKKETEFLQMKELCKETKMVRRDGSAHKKGKSMDDTVISPYLDETNEIVSYTAIYHDITDKKRIELLSVTDPLTNSITVKIR